MITLNNTQLEFRFSFKAIKGIEAKREKKLADIFTALQDVEKGIDFDLVLDLAYFGLAFTKNPKTYEELEEIFDKGTKKEIEEVLTAFASGVNAYLEVDPNAKSQTS